MSDTHEIAKTNMARMLKAAATDLRRIYATLRTLDEERGELLELADHLDEQAGVRADWIAPEPEPEPKPLTARQVRLLRLLADGIRIEAAELASERAQLAALGLIKFVERQTHHASITQDRAERRRAVCHLCHGSGKRLSDTSSHHRDGKTCWSFTYDACTCLAGLVRGGVR